MPEQSSSADTAGFESIAEGIASSFKQAEILMQQFTQQSQDFDLDPLKAAPVYSELMNKMLQNPHKVMQANLDLWKQGLQIYQNSLQSLINDGDEYLYVKMQPLMDDDIRAFGEMGDTHNYMDEDLREHMGKEVAIGYCPPFIDPDNDAMISASKSGIAGPRKVTMMMNDRLVLGVSRSQHASRDNLLD